MHLFVVCNILRAALVMLRPAGPDLLAAALAQVGVQARTTTGAPDHEIDLVLDPGGVEVQVKHRALVTGEVARRLLGETPLPDRVLRVVADRVTEDAGAVLTGHHADYFELRGHLAIRSATIVIDVDVELVFGRAERTNALNGTVGLEVATALLMNPAEGVAVRELARRLGRSASTVSEILAGLRSADLADERHRIKGTELFWQVAERWPAARAYLANLPMPGDVMMTRSLRLGLEEAEQTAGWALTDSAAAAAYGAPLAVSTGQLLDFYVPDQATARRATTLLGAAPSRTQARCAIRVAPVPVACNQRVDLASNPFEWPLAHPVFVALDLAQDAGRGREVLADWTPPERWARVW